MDLFEREPPGVEWALVDAINGFHGIVNLRNTDRVVFGSNTEYPLVSGHQLLTELGHPSIGKPCREEAISWRGCAALLSVTNHECTGVVPPPGPLHREGAPKRLGQTLSLGFENESSHC